ncbi:MAG: ferrochelatase [Nocardioidaceae bacterium]|nr:ferrochelatase [Nocardioidaceae bacterium]
MTSAQSASQPPYDAILLLSFGGPEKPEDVMPFLENVTRGRGIPRERLEEVGAHYFQFGGRSPINDQNRALISALEADLAAAGVDLPVYWGNRNWEPYLGDTVRQMAADGVRRAVCVTTSAYSSWSSCRQYLDNLDEALAGLPEGSELTIDKVGAYYDHPGFVAPSVDHTVNALDDLPADVRDDARLLFVTHSIPTAMNDESGPEGGRYLAQHLEVAARVAAGVATATGVARQHELVFCSRSGSPRTPWLEPDVNDRIRELSADGVRAVVMVPVGFVSDHMEVVYDLDTEAMATAGELGIEARRAGTAGTDPRFVAALRELVSTSATTRGACRRCPDGCCLPRS